MAVFSPENQGFTAAIADGSLEQGDLSSPDFVRQLVIDSIVPEALTLDQLRTMDYVETAGGTDLPVTVHGGEAISCTADLYSRLGGVIFKLTLSGRGVTFSA